MIMDKICILAFLSFLLLHRVDGQFPSLFGQPQPRPQIQNPFPQPNGIQPTNSPFLPIQPQGPVSNTVPPVAPVAPRITTTPAPLNPACCAIAVNSRRLCGYEGIPESRCVARKCCFDNDKCFSPNTEPCVVTTPPTTTTAKPTLAPLTAASCLIVPTFRKDCGYSGITKNVCSKLRCCFDDKAIGNSPKCFFSRENAPRFTQWADWSACSNTEKCEEGSQTRARSCTYIDERKAPGSLCNGKEQETRPCVCLKPCEDELGEDSCSTWKDMCENSVVKENCRKTCKLCTESPKVVAVLQTCKDNSPTCSRFETLCKTSKPFRDSMCKKTCNTCGAGGSPTAAPQAAKATPAAMTTTTTIETPLKRGDCEDKFVTCRNITQYCRDEKHIEDLREACPVTCNLCPVPPVPSVLPPFVPAATQPPLPSVTTTKNLPLSPGSFVAAATLPPLTTTTTQPGTKVCKDKFDTCPTYKNLCEGKELSESLRENCPVTCNKCPIGSIRPLGPVQPVVVATQSTAQAPTTTTGNAGSNECKDQFPACAEYSNLCKGKDLSESMVTMCPVTCKTCTPAVPIITTTTPYSQPLPFFTIPTTVATTTTAFVYRPPSTTPFPTTPNTVPTTTLAPAGNQYLQWTEWNECHVTCGSGFQTRSRDCISTINCLKEFGYRTCTMPACGTFSPLPTTTTAITTKAPIVIPNAPSGDCKDLAATGWCTQMKSQIRDFCQNRQLAPNCRLTCGSCGRSLITKTKAPAPVTTATTTSTPLRTQPPQPVLKTDANTPAVCEDKIPQSFCERMKKDVPTFCENKILSGNCQKACAKCS